MQSDPNGGLQGKIYIRRINTFLVSILFDFFTVLSQGGVMYGVNGKLVFHFALMSGR